jgi:hypothetical protein
MSKARKFSSFLLAVVLASNFFVTSAMATSTDADKNGQLTGDSTTNNVTLRVTVPGNLNFAIDPFEQGNSIGGGQITGASYAILNKTKADVKVTFDFKATPATSNGPTLVSDRTEISPDDPSKTDKKLFFAVLGAASITGAPTPTATYDESETGTLVPFDAAGDATIDFVLAAGDGTDAVAGTDGAAAFTFFGALNTYASWVNSDISVVANYTLTPLRPETYTALKANVVGVNQIATVPAEPGFYGDSKGANAHTSAAFALNPSAMPTTYDIKFNSDGKTVTMTTSSGAAFPAGDYSYNSNTNTLTINKSRLDLYKKFTAGESVVAHIKLAGETEPYVVKFSFI